MSAKCQGRNNTGFTFIELLIAIAILGILAAVSYPHYNQYTQKARRAEIAGVLVEEAQKLERFYSRAGQYTNHAGPPAMNHDVSAGNGFYAITTERTAQAFELTAMPVSGTMMSSDDCGGFVLDHTGRRDNRGVSGGASVGRCWGR